MVGYAAAKQRSLLGLFLHFLRAGETLSKDEQHVAGCASLMPFHIALSTAPWQW